jgi:hypothetical protein
MFFRKKEKPKQGYVHKPRQFDRDEKIAIQKIVSTIPVTRKLLSQESAWPWYGQLMRRPQTIAYLLQLDFWLRQNCVEYTF